MASTRKSINDDAFESYFNTERNDMLFTRGRRIKYVNIAPKGVEKVQIQATSDGAFGSYFNTERNHMLFTRGCRTKYVYIAPKGVEKR